MAAKTALPALPDALLELIVDGLESVCAWTDILSCAAISMAWRTACEGEQRWERICEKQWTFAGLPSPLRNYRRHFVRRQACLHHPMQKRELTLREVRLANRQSSASNWREGLFLLFSVEQDNKPLLSVALDFAGALKGEDCNWEWALRKGQAQRIHQMVLHNSDDNLELGSCLYRVADEKICALVPCELTRAEALGYWCCLHETTHEIARGDVLSGVLRRRPALPQALKTGAGVPSVHAAVCMDWEFDDSYDQRVKNGRVSAWLGDNWSEEDLAHDLWRPFLPLLAWG